MNQNENEVPDSVHHLASDAMEQVAGMAEEYCTHETERLQYDNYPKIIEAQATLSLLEEQRQRLCEMVRSLPATSCSRYLRSQITYFWTVFAFLAIAGFALCVLTLEPYRFGFKMYLYSLAVSIVVPFALDSCLKYWDDPRLLRVVATAAALAGFGGVILLALVRSEVLLRLADAAAPVVVVGDGTAPSSALPDFAAMTRSLLQCTMILISAALELGSGLALHEVRRLSAMAPDDGAEARRQLAQVQIDKIACAKRLATLQNAPLAFEAAFRRDFYRSLLSRVGAKTLIQSVIAVTVLAFASSTKAAEPPKNLVITLVDLTASQAVALQDRRSEFAMNVAAVSSLIAELPAGTALKVIGITDASFARPARLLSASLSGDAGYFGERLASGRHQIDAAWKKASENLSPPLRAKRHSRGARHCRTVL